MTNSTENRTPGGLLPRKTGLTIMGLHFQQSYQNGVAHFRDFWGKKILVQWYQLGSTFARYVPRASRNLNPIIGFSSIVSTKTAPSSNGIFLRPSVQGGGRGSNSSVLLQVADLLRPLRNDIVKPSIGTAQTESLGLRHKLANQLQLQNRLKGLQR